MSMHPHNAPDTVNHGVLTFIKTLELLRTAVTCALGSDHQLPPFIYYDAGMYSFIHLQSYTWCSPIKIPIKQTYFLQKNAREVIVFAPKTFNCTYITNTALPRLGISSKPT